MKRVQLLVRICRRLVWLSPLHVFDIRFVALGSHLWSSWLLSSSCFSPWTSVQLSTNLTCRCGTHSRLFYEERDEKSASQPTPQASECNPWRLVCSLPVSTRGWDIAFLIDFCTTSSISYGILCRHDALLGPYAVISICLHTFMLSWSCFTSFSQRLSFLLLAWLPEEVFCGHGLYRYGIITILVLI